MSEILWRPDDDTIAQANLTAFAARHGFAPPDYDALHAWSIAQRGEFWNAVWEDGGVIASRRASAPLADGDRFPGSRWFPGARLNFAQNLLRAAADPALRHRVAIVSVLENGQRRELTYGELAAATASFAAELREFGVNPGDRVAGWLPNVPQTVVAMLATASIGAVWSSCSPDFGIEGALDRFGQIEPVVLIACERYQYGGRTFDVRERAEKVASALPSVRRLLWVATDAADAIDDALRRFPDAEARFEQLPFEHPLYVMYSSGTTGKPKCIVHGAGGTLLQHIKEHRLHVDLTPDDTLFFFTTCGWMMWNWLVSALAVGCRIVLYDGSPFYRQPNTLLELAERERITAFGVSAKYLSALEKARVRPGRTHDLSAMRTVLSTGSPLTEDGFRFVCRDVRPGAWLASISGGTDILSCFVLGNPWLPVRAGEIQCKGLGMAVEVFDEAGQPALGVKGELVCTRSFPSAPVGFWDDPDGARYRAAYFERFAGVWAHGDFAELRESGGMVIHGRSDAVLNPGGVRIGTAEIYRVVEALDEVVEALAIGQEWDGDTRVVLFVVLREGTSLTAKLRATIRNNIRRQASPRHTPAVIVQMPDVPRTLSGKIAELAVRETVHGREATNLSALANPESLDAFRNHPELATNA